MFIAELSLYINFIKEQLENDGVLGIDAKRLKYFVEYFKNVQAGIDYYKNLPQTVAQDLDAYSESLHLAETTLEVLSIQYAIHKPGTMSAA